MSASRIAAAAILAALIAGCTPSTIGGVRGYTAFAATARVERHHSPRSAPEVAACFRTTARFLPRTRFEPMIDGGTRYVLAGYGLWFEEIVFTPGAYGSDVEVRSSGAYAGKWVTMLVRDRLEPLGRCLAATGDKQ